MVKRHKKNKGIKWKEMEQVQRGHMEEVSTKVGVICRFVSMGEQLANTLRVTLDGPKVEGPMK